MTKRGQSPAPSTTALALLPSPAGGGGRGPEHSWLWSCQNPPRAGLASVQRGGPAGGSASLVSEGPQQGRPGSGAPCTALRPFLPKAARERQGLSAMAPHVGVKAAPSSGALRQVWATGNQQGPAAPACSLDTAPFTVKHRARPWPRRLQVHTLSSEKWPGGSLLQGPVPTGTACSQRCCLAPKTVRVEVLVGGRGVRGHRSGNRKGQPGTHSPGGVLLYRTQSCAQSVTHT